MLTIREIKNRTESFFVEKGIPDSKLDADLLIAYSLGIKRLEIYLNMERPLTDSQLDVLRPLIKRRASREPLQYIIGKIQFAGSELKVDSRVLIPRPETEELFDLICRKVSKPPRRILDLGTGSGALAIALARKFPEAEVSATDFSDEGLSLAMENADIISPERQIHFFKSWWYDSIPEGEPYDLIVSNPPYLTEKEMETAAPEVALYEPAMALVAGPDGLEALRIIIAGAHRYLKSGGMLAMETGIAQQAELKRLAESAGFIGECWQDFRGHSRFCFCR